MVASRTVSAMGKGLARRIAACRSLVQMQSPPGVITALFCHPANPMRHPLLTVNAP